MCVCVLALSSAWTYFGCLALLWATSGGVEILYLYSAGFRFLGQITRPGVTQRPPVSSLVGCGPVFGLQLVLPGKMK